MTAGLWEYRSSSSCAPNTQGEHAEDHAEGNAQNRLTYIEVAANARLRAPIFCPGEAGDGLWKVFIA